MKIIWHGQSCFQIIAHGVKENKATIVIDPFSEEIGLKLPKIQADILLVTHQHLDHNNINAVSNSPFLITGPGEYEIKDIFIQGIPAFHGNSKEHELEEITIYTFEAENITLCHLGDLGQKELTDEQLERIGNVDILMIPIGGNFTISAQEALKIMSQIEPKIIIPMHYQIPKLKIKLSGLDKFLKVLGIQSVEHLPKLLIKKKDISEEEAKIIAMKPQ